MYRVLPSNEFRKQVKRLAKADRTVLKKLEATIERLRLGKTLALAQKDHKLIGKFLCFRECHVTPDWLLIYRKDQEILILELISTGTHSTLFE